MTIVNKFVSNKDGGAFITLDTLFENQTVDFIKMDVEGAEIDILNGAVSLIERSEELKITVYTYHRQTDAEDIQNILNKHHFAFDFSSGYMLFLYSKMIPPYFRRGLIRAFKIIDTCAELPG